MAASCMEAQTPGRFLSCRAFRNENGKREVTKTRRRMQAGSAPTARSRRRTPRSTSPSRFRTFALSILNPNSPPVMGPRSPMAHHPLEDALDDVLPAAFLAGEGEHLVGLGAVPDVTAE